MGRIFYDFLVFGKRSGAFLRGLRKICRDEMGIRD